MATPVTDETRTLIKLLQSGEWMPYSKIYESLAATVPPGKAVRRYRSRVAQRELHEGPRRTPELPEDQQIASGQRTLANVTINSAKKRFVEIDIIDGEKRIRLRPGVEPPTTAARSIHDREPETKEDHNGQLSLLNDPPTSNEPHAPAEPPATLEPYPCDRCGLYVANTTQHEEFHATNDRPPKTRVNDEDYAAFFTARQVAAIVRTEIRTCVEDELDAFQRGLERYLNDRFGYVDHQLVKLLDELRPKPAANGAAPAIFRRRTRS